MTHVPELPGTAAGAAGTAVRPLRSDHPLTPAFMSRGDTPQAPPPTSAARHRREARQSPGADLGEWWTELRSRFLLKACDAILTAHLLGDEASPRSGRRSNYGRMHAVARLTHLVLPAGMAWLRRRVRRHRFLPFAEQVTDVLGFGTGSTVFLLRRRGGAPRADLVMKVYRRTLGKPLPTLLKHAAAFRDRYRTVSGWYAGTSLIVPAVFLLLQGPLLGRPAVAAVQPFIDDEKWDLFDLVATGGFAALTREHPALRAEFRCFVERTFAVLDAHARCLDLVGRNNVLVVREGGELRLRVIDYGVFDLAEQQARAPHRVAAVAARVTRLLGQYEEIYGHVPPTGGSRPRRV